MVKKTLDDEVDSFIKEDNAQHKAVSALIDVRPTTKEKGSDIELKSDLDERQICIHTAVDIMNDILKMSPEEFLITPILAKLTEKKERKSVSKDRKSREEIVNVARNPDMQQVFPNENTGMMKRFFSPKRQQ